MFNKCKIGEKKIRIPLFADDLRTFCNTIAKQQTLRRISTSAMCASEIYYRIYFFLNGGGSRILKESPVAAL